MLVTGAVRARDVAAVLRKVLEAVRRLDHQIVALVAPQAIRAARHRGEHVVRVHGAEDERRTVPRAAARSAPQTARPSLEARHAHGAQVLLTPLGSHGNARFGVLLWRQEERAVDERVPVVDLHGALANDAIRLRHSRHGQVGQDEASDVVVAVAALVFHFNVKRVDFVPWQHVERTVVGPVQKQPAVARTAPIAIVGFDGDRSPLVGGGSGGGRLVMRRRQKDKLRTRAARRARAARH